MLAKPNGSYSSYDLAMLSRVLKEALIVSVDSWDSASRPSKS